MSRTILVLWVSTLSGCHNGSGEDSATYRGEAPEFEAQNPSNRRLTEDQYRNTIASLFGPGLALPTKLDPVDPVEGLEAVGASLSTFSPLGVERFEEAAHQVAEQLIADPELYEEVISCDSGEGFSSTCVRDSIAALGLEAWRRPLAEEELDVLVEIGEQAQAVLSEFDSGMQYVLAALLLSPHFLYRVELGEEDPAGGWRYTSWEMASRLSYFLWNTMPDTSLFEAAETGDLLTEEGVAEQVDRMLEDPRARDGARAFFTDIYDLDLLDEMTKDPLIFRHMSDDLGASAREETLAGLERIVFDEDTDFSEILRTRDIWIDRRLAAIYGVPAPSMDGFGWTTLPVDGGRRGLLGQVSFLALYAHPVSSSVTLRGIFVRERLLCQIIPDPPADVNTAIPEASSDQPTMRERVERHLSDPACANCHEITDYIGLGLENFDGIARWRTRDNDVVIDASGQLDGVNFSDAWDLTGIVADHSDLAPCLAEHAYRYAMGRNLTYGESDLVDWHIQGFGEEQKRVLFLMRDISTSPAFRQMAAPE